jgi:hypothetical protein
MRLRDHNKGDLALTALTLAVAAAAAASGTARWASRRRLRRHGCVHVQHCEVVAAPHLRMSRS